MQSEPTNLRERMFSMLQTAQWTDCKFLVGDEVQEVEVHKAILASASPVFAAMFYGEMRESQTTIPIPDIKPDIFQAMLEYIYTDEVKLSSFGEASNLYYAADKYTLTNLKKICITYMEPNLTIDNVCQVYEFGEMFEEKTLMNQCLDFIQGKENTKKILKDELRNKICLDKVKLSTLVTIFSLEKMTAINPQKLFWLTKLYVAIREKCNVSSTNSDSDGELSSKKSSESSTLQDTVVVNEENKAEDSKEASEGSMGQDKMTTPPLTESKEKPNIRALLEKIHFLKMSPQQFANGPAKSELLTSAEKYAILMNIASDETNIPMPSGFSTYRDKE